MRPVAKFLGLFCLMLAASALSSPQAQASFTAPAIVCNQGFSTSTATCSAAGAPCAVAGQLVNVAMSYYQSSGAQSVVTMVNTNGDSFGSPDADSATGANNYRTVVFHTVANSSSCTTYTATLSGTVSFGNFSVTKASGNDPVNPFDAIATPLTFSSNANPQVGPNLTTTQTGDLIIAVVNCAAGSNGWGAGAGYTQLDTTHVSNAWITEYQIVGAAGSYNATFSNSTTCSFGTSIGNLVTVAYKTGSPVTHSQLWIINMSGDRRGSRKLPWDDRRRKLQIITI